MASLHNWKMSTKISKSGSPAGPYCILSKKCYFSFILFLEGGESPGQSRATL